ncbi:hypothetical protein B0H11DRAFT_1915278 [Mycena galericulata]|nr:hypothetical protein B0H11DRAFT_1915278 [Mycena galericulata]
MASIKPTIANILSTDVIHSTSRHAPPTRTEVPKRRGRPKKVPELNNAPKPEPARKNRRPLLAHSLASTAILRKKLDPSTSSLSQRRAERSLTLHTPRTSGNNPFTFQFSYATSTTTHMTASASRNMPDQSTIISPELVQLPPTGAFSPFPLTLQAHLASVKNSCTPRQKRILTSRVSGRASIITPSGQNADHNHSSTVPRPAGERGSWGFLYPNPEFFYKDFILPFNLTNTIVIPRAQPAPLKNIILPKTDTGLERLMVKISKDNGGNFIFESINRLHAQLRLGQYVIFCGTVQGRWRIERLIDCREGYAYLLCHEHELLLGTFMRISEEQFWAPLYNSLETAENMESSLTRS